MNGGRLPYGTDGYEVELSEYDEQPRRATGRRAVKNDTLSSRAGIPTSARRFSGSYKTSIQEPLVETKRSRSLKPPQQPQQNRPRNRRDPNTDDDKAIRRIEAVKWSNGVEEDIYQDEEADATTEALVLVEPSMPVVSNRQQRRQWRFHPLVFFSLGVLLVVLLITGWVNVACWYSNMHDPQVHAISAHMALEDVKEGLHQYHLQAFVASGHLDLLVVPDGNWQKAKVMIGPDVSGFKSDPDKAWIEVDDSQSGQITVKLLGPYASGLPGPVRSDTVTWTILIDEHGDIKQGGVK